MGCSPSHAVTDASRLRPTATSRCLSRMSEPEERNGGATSDPRLIRAEDAARLLGVPKTWVLAEARADRIPHVRLGRYVRFEARELEAWWRARRRGPRFQPRPAS